MSGNPEPIRSLACAKILTMIQDLSGHGVLGGNPERKEAIRQRAERWFFSNEQEICRDFESWCITAGYEPEMVREKARSVLERGYFWRSPAGQGARYAERRAYHQRRKQITHHQPTEENCNGL